MRKKNRPKVVAEGRIGPPCPRCGQDTQVRVHPKITDKLLKQPFYYSEWYYCMNNRCKTSLLMPEKFKVFPDNPKSSNEGTAERLSAISEQLSPLGGPLPWED